MLAGLPLRLGNPAPLCGWRGIINFKSSMQPKKDQINSIWPLKESACPVRKPAFMVSFLTGFTFSRRALLLGLFKIQARLFAPEDPGKISFVTDDYKNAEYQAYNYQEEGLFKKQTGYWQGQGGNNGSQ